MKASEVKSLEVNTTVFYKKSMMYFRGFERVPESKKILMKLAKVHGGRTTAKASPSAVKRYVSVEEPASGCSAGCCA